MSVANTQTTTVSGERAEPRRVSGKGNFNLGSIIGNGVVSAVVIVSLWPCGSLRSWQRRGKPEVEGSSPRTRRQS